MARAYIEIPLSGKVGAGRIVLIDISDYDKVIQHSWFAKRTPTPDRFYARTNIRVRRGYGGQATLCMHNLITGWNRVDHHNHDGLDNRRHNLRKATSSQNSGNRRPNRNGTSVYKGVSWSSSSGKWVAIISRNLGYFENEEEAARAYDRAAKETWGDFAYLNFPE